MRDGKKRRKKGCLHDEKSKAIKADEKADENKPVDLTLLLARKGFQEALSVSVWMPI